jgi:hypothetical protein
MRRIFPGRSPGRSRARSRQLKKNAGLRAWSRPPGRAGLTPAAQARIREMEEHLQPAEMEFRDGPEL